MTSVGVVSTQRDRVLTTRSVGKQILCCKGVTGGSAEYRGKEISLQRSAVSFQLSDREEQRNKEQRNKEQRNEEQGTEERGTEEQALSACQPARLPVCPQILRPMHYVLCTLHYALCTTHSVLRTRNRVNSAHAEAQTRLGCRPRKGSATPPGHDPGANGARAGDAPADDL